MPKSIEAPDASQFPEKSPKLGVLIDTLAIRHKGNVMINRFDETFVDPEFKSNNPRTNLYDIANNFADMVELAQKTNSVMIISELVRVMTHIENSKISSDTAEEWQKELFTIDDSIEEMVDTDVWFLYVDELDSKSSTRVATSFQHRHEQRLLERDSVLREIIAQKYRSLFRVDEERIYTDDDADRELRPIKINSSDLERMFPAILRLGDPVEIEHALYLLLDSDLYGEFFSFEKGYSVPVFAENLMRKLYEIDPELVNKFIRKNKTGSEDKTALALEFTAACITKNVQVLFNQCRRETSSARLKSYMLAKLGSLLSDKEVQIPDELRSEIEQYMVIEISYLDDDHKLEALVEFQHPSLVSDAAYALSQKFKKDYFDTSLYKKLLQFVLKYGDDKDKALLRDAARSEVLKDVHMVNSSDERDEVEKDLSSNRASVAAELGKESEDLELLEELADHLIYSLGNRTSSYETKRILADIAPIIIEKGNSFAVNHIVKLAVGLYEQLESVAVSSYIQRDLEIDFIVDGIPTMLAVFDAVHKFKPDLQIELGEGKNIRWLNAATVNKRVAEFYTWMSRGIDVFYSNYSWLINEISAPLDLARYILERETDPKIVNQIRMALLAEAVRRYSLDQNSWGEFYIDLANEYVGGKHLNEDEIFEFLSQSNLAWIINMLLPQDKSTSASQN